MTRCGKHKKRENILEATLYSICILDFGYYLVRIDTTALSLNRGVNGPVYQHFWLVQIRTVNFATHVCGRAFWSANTIWTSHKLCITPIFCMPVFEIKSNLGWSFLVLESLSATFILGADS